MNQTAKDAAIRRAESMMRDYDAVTSVDTKTAIASAVAMALAPHGLTWDMVKNRKKSGLAILLVDESGSMQTRYDDTVNGINGFIKEWENSTQIFPFISLMTFDLPPSPMEDAVRVLADNVYPAACPKLSKENYKPRGMTPLYDAILVAIESGDKAREKDPDIAITVVIQTDGYENASRRASHGGLKEMIRTREANGWQFIFLGADLGRATYEASSALGVGRGATVSYVSGQSVGTYGLMAEAAAQFTNSRVKANFTAAQKASVGDNVDKEPEAKAS